MSDHQSRDSNNELKSHEVSEQRLFDETELAMHKSEQLRAHSSCIVELTSPKYNNNEGNLDDNDDTPTVDLLGEGQQQQQEQAYAWNETATASSPDNPAAADSAANVALSITTQTKMENLANDATLSRLMEGSPTWTAKNNVQVGWMVGNAVAVTSGAVLRFSSSRSHRNARTRACVVFVFPKSEL